MIENKKIFRYNLIAIICAVIFLLAGWMWTYFLNLFIAYPVGLVGLFFWYKARTQRQFHLMSIIAISLLGAGLFVSFAALLLFR